MTASVNKEIGLKITGVFFFLFFLELPINNAGSEGHFQNLCITRQITTNNKQPGVAQHPKCPIKCRKI